MPGAVTVSSTCTLKVIAEADSLAESGSEAISGGVGALSVAMLSAILSTDDLPLLVHAMLSNASDVAAKSVFISLIWL